MGNEFSDLVRVLHTLPGVDRVKLRQDEGGLLPRAVVELDNGRKLSVVRFSFISFIDRERPFEIAELTSTLSLLDPGEVHGGLSMEEVIDRVTYFAGRQAKSTFSLISHRVLRKLKL